MAWIFNMLTVYEKVKTRNHFLKKQHNETVSNQNQVYNFQSAEKVYNIQSSVWYMENLVNSIPRQIPFLLTTTSASIIFIHLLTHAINFQRKRKKCLCLSWLPWCQEIPKFKNSLQGNSRKNQDFWLTFWGTLFKDS